MRQFLPVKTEYSNTGRGTVKVKQEINEHGKQGATILQNINNHQTQDHDNYSTCMSYNLIMCKICCKNVLKPFLSIMSENVKMPAMLLYRQEREGWNVSFARSLRMKLEPGCPHLALFLCLHIFKINFWFTFRMFQHLEGLYRVLLWFWFLLSSQRNPREIP